MTLYKPDTNQNKKICWLSMTLRVLALIFLIGCITISGYSQEQKSVKQQAESAYKLGEYAIAARLYEKEANRLGKKADVKMLEKLGDCYAQINNYVKSAEWYGVAAGFPGSDSTDWLYCGDMYKALGRYPEAKSAYQKYAAKSGDPVSNRIAGCDSAVVWLATPNPAFQVINFKDINTAGSEWGAINYKKEGVVFTSDSLRNSVLDPKAKIARLPDGRTDRPFYKLYEIDYKQKELIHGFMPVLNNSQYHVGPVTFSHNYDTAYVTVTNFKNLVYAHEGRARYAERKLELYICVSKNGQWQAPISFPYNNPDAYSVGHAVLNATGDILYYTSDMPNGYGKTDIWYSQKDPDGSWGQPHNCGPVINTAEEEAFPAIGSDEALYFSSKGHIGLGGFDIFRSEGEKGTWEMPENLKPPINSPGEDFCFQIIDDYHGYLASNREGGKGGDDIYKLSFDLTSYGKVIITGTISDGKTGKPLPGSAVHIVSDNIDTIVKSNPLGEYSIKLKSKPSYTITADKEDYEQGKKELTHVERNNRVDIPLMKLPPPPPVTIDTPKIRTAMSDLDSLRNISVGRFNINYNFDKSDIRPQDREKLEQIVELMLKDFSLNIIVASFTDCKGSDAYNIKLSERRSASVRKYLESKGVSSKRINTEFFGKGHPLRACEDKDYDVNKQLENRRSELLLTRNTHGTWEKERTKKTEGIPIKEEIQIIEKKRDDNGTDDTDSKKEKNKKKIYEDIATENVVWTPGQARISDEEVRQRFERAIEEMKARKNVQLERESKISGDSLQIELFDNGSYDHDTVTVFFNDQVIVYKQELQIRTPIKFKIMLSDDDKGNKLTFFADNLGEVPPNTAVIVITDNKGYRYEENISSDLHTNTVIWLKKRTTDPKR